MTPVLMFVLTVHHWTPTSFGVPCCVFFRVHPKWWFAFLLPLPSKKTYPYPSEQLRWQDMYHLVSAVVLGFTTSVFTEGRIWAHSPPSYIAVYFMTIGRGPYVYLPFAPKRQRSRVAFSIGSWVVGGGMRHDSGSV